MNFSNLDRILSDQKYGWRHYQEQIARRKQDNTFGWSLTAPPEEMDFNKLEKERNRIRMMVEEPSAQRQRTESDGNRPNSARQVCDACGELGHTAYMTERCSASQQDRASKPFIAFRQHWTAHGTVPGESAGIRVPQWARQQQGGD